MLLPYCLAKYSASDRIAISIIRIVFFLHLISILLSFSGVLGEVKEATPGIWWEHPEQLIWNN